MILIIIQLLVLMYLSMSFPTPLPRGLHTFTGDLTVCIAPTLGTLTPYSTSLQINE